MAQPTAFGALLKRYRLARGFTQEDLAARAGYSTVYVSMLERGRRLPLPSTLTSLCEALALAPRDRAALHAVVRPQEDGAALRQALVGRPHEQASVDHHLSGEGPPLFLLAGEPGIGKSRLLQEVARRAVGYGLRVLEGGCQRRGGQEPYAPVLGALQHHIRGQSSAQLAQDVRGCAWLVRLLPELAEGPIEPLPNWTVAPAQERRLVFEAVTRFLTNVAAPAGTLLVLDDLQWADPDALDLLALLGRAAAEIPLRIVGAYRDTEARPQDALSTTLADLAHAGLVRQITLSPLPDQAAAQLLDRLLQDVEGTTEALRDRVLQRAAGVPFFLVSCAQGLRLGT